MKKTVGRKSQIMKKTVGRKSRWTVPLSHRSVLKKLATLLGGRKLLISFVYSKKQDSLPE